MNLSSCKRQTLFLLTVLSYTVVASEYSHAAIVSITANLGSRFLGGDFLVRSSFGGEYGLLQSFAKSFTVTTDTVADTAFFRDMQFDVALAGGDTRSKSSTMVIPPTNFPDPPKFITNTFTETITFDPINPAHVAPQLVSSTVGAITYDHGFQYRFPSNVAVAFPGSFFVSGMYKMEGRTQTVTVPFNVEYSRFRPDQGRTGPSTGFIYVGNNFPNTAELRATSADKATYRPSNGTIFNGTVDGQQFDVRFLFDVNIFAALPIPEPATWLLAFFAALLLPIRRG